MKREKKLFDELVKFCEEHDLIIVSLYFEDEIASVCKRGRRDKQTLDWDRCVESWVWL